MTTGRILFFHDAIYMGLDIFCDVVVEILRYCAPMNELHVLDVEKVYRKYILNVPIDNIMDYLKEMISIFAGLAVFK